MNSIKITSLYSGSTGNATLIQTERTAILIDAGKSARSLQNAVKQAGGDPSRIEAVFVTHEHTDHISALEVFLKKHRVPVHFSEPSAQKIRRETMPNLSANLRAHPPVFSVKVGDLTVSSFALSHDSAMCIGYRIDTDWGYSAGIATDTGVVTETTEKTLSGCRAVIIESNHSVDMLKCGPYPYELKKRIMSRFGHLSNDDCARTIQHLAASGTSHFMLAHLSEENNRAEYALACAKKALGEFSDVKLCAAKPEELTVLVDYVQG